MRKIALFMLIVIPLPAADQPPAEEPILEHLNQAIAWYRRLAAQAQVATEASDVIFIDHDIQLARQAVAQAFDGARALASLGSAAPGSPAAPSTLAKRAADAADAAQKSQAEVEALQRQLEAAPPGRRAGLEEQLAETKSELAFAQARAQTLKTLSDFSAQIGGDSAGLAGQIDELERSVPEVRAQPTSIPPPAASSAPPRRSGEGVIGLAQDLFALPRKQREIRESLAQTVQLRAASERLRAPLASQLRTTLQQGEELASAPAEAEASVLADRRQRLDQITAQFKKASGALLEFR